MAAPLDQIPREAKLASLLLSSSGVGECEPKVIQQLIEFMYRYVTDVLQETTLYAEHAGKTELDTEDVRLAIKNQMRHMFVPPPSREFMLELAARKNVIPLPSIEAHTGLRLPMDKNTLLGANYRITSQRKPPTTTKVVDQYVRVTNEQADSVCNNLTPQKRRASNK